MSQVTPQQLQALLNYASARLGMTPEQLARTVQQGGISALADKVGGEKAADMEKLAGNRQQVEQLMQSPAAQALIQKLLGGQ